MGGLLPDDFEIYEDGRRQSLAFFVEQSSNISTPLSVVLAIDGYQRKRRELKQLERSLWPFLKALPATAELSLALRRDEAVEVTPFDLDRSPEQNLLGNLGASRPEGLLALLTVSIARLDEAPNRRKILIVASGRGSLERDGKAAGLSKDLDESRIVLFDVRMHQASSEPDFVSRLASHTGGRTFRPSGTRELRSAFHSLGNELRNHYVLGYFADDFGQEPRFRQIEVRLREGAMGSSSIRLRARRGYRR